MAPDTIPPAVAEGLQKLIEQHLLDRGDRRVRNLGTFWPILVGLVATLWAAYATFERASNAEAKADKIATSIDDPRDGIRASVNSLDKKVDRLGVILEERLPAKPH